MTERTYTLTYVKSTGKAHTTSATGYHAEAMMDIEYKTICTDPNVLFAVLLDGSDSPRNVYYGK